MNDMLMSPSQAAECEALTWALAHCLERDPAAKAISHVFSPQVMTALLDSTSGDARL